MKPKFIFTCIVIASLLFLNHSGVNAQEVIISYTHIPERPNFVLSANVSIPAPAPDYLWIEGYWNWNPRYGQYKWVEGYWVSTPYPEATWIPAQWIRVNNRYQWRDAYWYYPPVHNPRVVHATNVVHYDNHYYHHGKPNKKEHRYESRDNRNKKSFDNKKSYDRNKEGNDNKRSNGNKSNDRKSYDRNSSGRR